MESQSNGAGLLASLKTLLGTLLGILRTRLEIIATELQEERIRLTRMFAFGVMGLFFFGLGAVALSFFIVAAFWETYRLTAIAGVALLHFGIAFYCLTSAKALGAQKSSLFEATLGELDKDRAAFTRQL